MATIKSIKVGETVYDIKATYDGSGNIIDQTYAKSSDVPTKVSQLENDSNYLTEHQDISGLATKEELNGKVDKVEGSGLVSDSKILTYDNHLSNTSNPHSVTKTQIGLGNVNNTSDLLKPISTATQEALDKKVDKELGKQLSTENYSTTEKEKLAGIEENANNYTHPLTHEASIITQDSTHRFVSDTEKTTWNNKAETTTATTSSNGLMSSSDKSKLDGIEANANNYTHPTTSGNKHIPTGGSDGQLLSYSEDGTAQWSDSTSKLDSKFAEMNTLLEELIQKVDPNLKIDLYSYGVEWDITVSSPVLTRIGNPLLHKSLPIQSSYRGCVSNGKVINYYLYPDDWNYKEDGVTPSVLDGTDGVVRVHTPKFYGKSGSNGNKRWVRISLVKIDDSWVEIPEMLIDAYRCTVDKSTNKAVSVVNTTANYRGGNDRSEYDTYLTDTPCRSDLGKPRTNVSRATMRTYANNAGSELLCYEYYKWIFYWAYVIEYANFNSQATYNAELTSDGYKQGGLGPGVTTLNGNYWNYYNGYIPLTPCGYCNEIGNNTGVKSMTIITPTSSGGDPTQTYNLQVPRWRGFDNPFGDIWTNLDGIVIHRTDSDQLSNVYTSTSEFTDEIGTKTVAGVETISDGWTKTYDLRETGEIIPSSVGGSESTYMCDYHFCNDRSTSLRTLLVGGFAYYGGKAGVGFFHSYYDVSYGNANVGFRSLIVL